MIIGRRNKRRGRGVGKIGKGFSRPVVYTDINYHHGQAGKSPSEIRKGFVSRLKAKDLKREKDRIKRQKEAKKKQRNKGKS